MPKVVVSSTLDDPEWNNTTVLQGDGAAGVIPRARGARVTLVACSAASRAS